VDNLRSYGTPNCYLQQLFARNRGDLILPAKLAGASGKMLCVSATRDEGRGEVVVKVVNGENSPADVMVNLIGDARLLVFTGVNRSNENSFTEPAKISPKETALKLSPENRSRFRQIR